MDIEAKLKLIHSLYITVSGKTEGEAFVIFRGYENGISEPFIARIDAKEHKHKTFDGAINGLLTILKNELASKVKSAEGEAVRLRSVLAKLEN